VVALFAGWYLGKLLVRVLGRRIARRFQRPSVTRTVLRSVRTGVFVMGALVAASTLGLRLGNVVLSVTVFSAVLGLVLAPIVGSVVNGLFVLADQPYEIGDMIEIQDTGQTGFIEDITLRYTKVFTLDNTFLVIPNATIRDRDVVNYSAEDERTRLSLQLLVTYEGDLAAARSLMERAARDVDAVIEGGPPIRIGSARYPATPQCYIEEYADHGVLLTLRYWAKEPYRLLTVRSAVQENVWAELEADDDVTVAYPHQHHVFDDTSGEARVRVDSGQ
jgi:small conductance mechanosensitive channel